MPTKEEAIAELYRRGALPPARTAAVEELMRRGALPPGPKWERVAANPPDRPLPDIKQVGDKGGVVELTHGIVSRPTMMALGGTAGVAASLPFAPLAGPYAPAIPVAGGATGTAAGSLLFDSLDSAVRWLRGEPDPRAGNPFGPARRALKEGAVDLAFGAGAQVLGPAYRAGKANIVGRAFGVYNDEARALTDAAKAEGVGLGLAHVSRRALAKGFVKTIGVFPFVSTPIREGQQRVIGQLDERAADLLNTLAPITSRGEVGVALKDAADRRYAKFNRIAASLYGDFYQKAEALPAGAKEIIPTAPIKDALAAIQQGRAKEAIPLSSGESAGPLAADPIGAWLNQFADLPERITVEQARGLERNLNQAMNQAAKEGYDLSRLARFKDALVTARSNLDVSNVPPEQASEVVAAWERANRFFATGRKTFETPTARRFGRVDKNIFEPGRVEPGTINADELFNAVVNARSPEALSDLRALVGKPAFHQAGRRYLEDALAASHVPVREGDVTSQMFSSAQFAKRLGIGTPDGDAALSEMLRGSGMHLGQIKKFLEISGRATDITVKDPATFLSRRIVLAGGLSGLGGALALGHGHVSIPAATFLTWIARKVGVKMMSQEFLGSVTRVMDTSLDDQARRQAFVRLLRMLPQDATPEPFNNAALFPTQRAPSPSGFQPPP